MASFRFLALLVCGCALLSTPAQAQHFTDCATSSFNATVILPRQATVETASGDALEPGDEIAVFTADGQCVGRGRWQGTSLAIPVASADAQESVGYEAGARLRYRIWDASSQQVSKAKAAYRTCGPEASALCKGDGRYKRNAIYRLTRLQVRSADPKPSETYALSGAAPNPFRTRTRFTLRVMQTQHVTATLFNVLGQRVRRLYDDVVEAGRPRTLTLDGRGLTSGLYFLRVRGETFATTRRVVRVR